MRYEANFFCDIFDLNQILWAKQIFVTIWNEIRSLNRNFRLKQTLCDMKWIFSAMWSEFLIRSEAKSQHFRFETNFSMRSDAKSVIWSEIHYLKQNMRVIWSDIRYLKWNKLSEIKYPCDPSDIFIRFEANSASWSKISDFKWLFVVFSVSKH